MKLLIVIRRMRIVKSRKRRKRLVQEVKTIKRQDRLNEKNLI